MRSSPLLRRFWASLLQNFAHRPLCIFSVRTAIYWTFAISLEMVQIYREVHESSYAHTRFVFPSFLDLVKIHERDRRRAPVGRAPKETEVYG